MSTTPDIRARELMDRLANLKTQQSSNDQESEELQDAMAIIKGQLRDLLQDPSLDDVTRGLIQSAIKPSNHVDSRFDYVAEA